MDPFLGEIRCFSFGKIPQGWLPCNGQTLTIQSNAALYALCGTTFGGNGTTTFSLPNLNGAAPMHYNPTANPPNAQTRVGTSGGAEGVALSVPQIPAHNHLLAVGTALADEKVPSGQVPGVLSSPHFAYAPDTNPQTTMSPSTVLATGNNAVHANMQPYQVISFCIACKGIWPTRP